MILYIYIKSCIYLYEMHIDYIIIIYIYIKNLLVLLFQECCPVTGNTLE